MYAEQRRPRVRASPTAVWVIQTCREYPAVDFVIDKNLDLAALTVPGYKVDSKIVRPEATYKGPHRDDEDYADVLQLAFERHGCVVSSDAAMIAKARRFHSYVVGHRKDRCMNGVIILPPISLQAQNALAKFLAGRTRIKIGGFKGEPFTVTLEDVIDANLGVNLRAANPTAAELCKCPWRDPKAV